MNKDQILINEGEKSSYMFLIKDGEFELTKKIKKDIRVDLDYRQFVNRDPEEEFNVQVDAQ